MNKNFRGLRKNLQFSQLELSIIAQVSPVMVSAVEKYNYIPSARVRAKLAGSEAQRRPPPQYPAGVSDGLVGCVGECPGW